MQSIASHVRNGGSLAEAIAGQGNYFPPHFARMVEVGERSGRLEVVLDRLAGYYQERVELRRSFHNAILWPCIQLFLALIVVALLIYVPTLFQNPGDENIDLLGFGLIGLPGLIKYGTFLLIAGAVLTLFYWAVRFGMFGFVTQLWMRAPLIGRRLRVFPESRFVQTLALTIDSGMDAWSAVDLSFRSAQASVYRNKAESAKQQVLDGLEIHDVLDRTGLFSRDTIEAIELGEETGRLSEMLEKHFRYLTMRVKTTMATIAYGATGIVWLSVACMIIFLIFRLYAAYTGAIDTAIEAV